MHSLLQPGILFLFYSYINMTGNSQLQDVFPLLSCLYIHIYIYIKKKILPSCFFNFLDMLGWGAFHLILLCPYACVGLARFFWPPNEWSCMTSGFRGYCAFVCLPCFPHANAHGCLFFVVSLHYCFEFHGIKYVQNSIRQQLHPLPPPRLSSFLSSYILLIGSSVSVW